MGFGKTSLDGWSQFQNNIVGRVITCDVAGGKVTLNKEIEDRIKNKQNMLDEACGYDVVAGKEYTLDDLNGAEFTAYIMDESHRLPMKPKKFQLSFVNKKSAQRCDVSGCCFTPSVVTRLGVPVCPLHYDKRGYKKQDEEILEARQNMSNMHSYMPTPPVYNPFPRQQKFMDDQMDALAYAMGQHHARHPRHEFLDNAGSLFINIGARPVSNIIKVGEYSVDARGPYHEVLARIVECQKRVREEQYAVHRYPWPKASRIIKHEDRERRCEMFVVYYQTKDAEVREEWAYFRHLVDPWKLLNKEQKSMNPMTVYEAAMMNVKIVRNADGSCTISGENPVALEPAIEPVKLDPPKPEPKLEWKVKSDSKLGDKTWGFRIELWLDDKMLYEQNMKDVDLSQCDEKVAAMKAAILKRHLCAVRESGPALFRAETEDRDIETEHVLGKACSAYGYALIKPKTEEPVETKIQSKSTTAMVFFIALMAGLLGLVLGCLMFHTMNPNGFAQIVEIFGS